MLHLEKNEIVSDLKKILKETGNHPEIQEKCKEALEKCNEYNKYFGNGVIDVDKVIEENDKNLSRPQQPFKEFIKSNFCIVDSFIFTLHKKKNCPPLVIDYICTFLANSLLHKNALKKLSEILNQKTTWSEHEKMKILQMSFYLVRSEDFNEEMAEDLFNYLLGLIDDPNKQIMNTAKPITIQIIDYLMNKCVMKGDDEERDDNEDGSRRDDRDGSKRDDNDEISLLKPTNDLPLTIDLPLTNNTPTNTSLPINSLSCNKKALKICINILQTNFSKRNISKNLSLFYGDVLMLVVHQKEIFTIPKFQDFFSSEIFPDIKTKLQEGSKEEKEKFIELLLLICEEKNDKEIQNLLQNLISICKEKDFEFILPLLLNLTFKILKPHVEGFLFNLLENYEMGSEMQSEVIWRLSEFVRRGNKGIDGMIDDKYMDYKGMDYEEGKDDKDLDYEIGALLDTNDLINVIPTPDTLLSQDTLLSNDIILSNDTSSHKIYSKYASKLIKIFESSKEIDFRLLNSVLEFSLQFENLDFFESIVKIFMRINKEEILLNECIKHKSLMKDSWEIVFEQIRPENTILNNLHFFNDEQIFFLTKSLTSNPTRWSLPETLSFYKSVFLGSTPTLKNPINIKILDLYGSSLLSLLNQNQTQKLLILNLYCEIILDYVGNLESSSILVQDTIGEMLRKALVLNVTTFGPLILKTLHILLRLSIPDNWDKYFLVIEMCSISPLHSDLFQVLILIIEKYLDLLSPNEFLILLSCIEDISEGKGDLSDKLSDKAINSFLEIGECIISIRVMKQGIQLDPFGQKDPLNQNPPLNTKLDFFEVWKSYLLILFEFTKNPSLREKSLRNLFKFIHSDSILLSPIESEFLFKKILIPLMNGIRDEVINLSKEGDDFEDGREGEGKGDYKDGQDGVDKEGADYKVDHKGIHKINNLLKLNPNNYNIIPPLDLIYIHSLLDELTKHDPLKFHNISYLESQLDLIKSILNYNFINLDLISKCLTPLSIRIQPPSLSILILNSKSNSSKIHFENSIPYDLVNETLFKFYKNLFEEYEKYPPKCFLLVLEDLKRFEKEKIKENIKMFDKILLGEEEVVKKVIEILLLGDEGCEGKVGRVEEGCDYGNKEEGDNGNKDDGEGDVLNNKPLKPLLNSNPNLLHNPNLNPTTLNPIHNPTLHSPHSSFILNYLLDFMTKSPFLASLLMKESKKSLNSKTICKFLRKIREVLDLYESLWEESLEITQEVSGLVEGEEEFKEFVELSKEIFQKGMEIIVEDVDEGDDGSKIEGEGLSEGVKGEDRVINNSLPSHIHSHKPSHILPPHFNFQIYNNKQFSHYLEHDPLKTKILKDSESKRTLSISKTLEYRRKERLLLKYLIIYYTKIISKRSKEGVEGGSKGVEGGSRGRVKDRDEQNRSESREKQSIAELREVNLLNQKPLKNNIINHPSSPNPFSLVLSLTQIKNSKPFNFYNLAFKSYHLLFLNVNLVFDELLLILKKTLKNYNEEEKLNNMLFSTIKQKEIYLVFELLIETKNKKLIENLKIEMLNCLKNKDLNVVEYVRKSLMVIFE